MTNEPNDEWCPALLHDKLATDDASNTDDDKIKNPV